MSSMALTAAPPASAREPVADSHRPVPAPLERAVLLTLVYSDLFDYPLTRQELRRYLPVPCTASELDEALAVLGTSRLHVQGGFICLWGREEIFDRRRRRAELAAGRWRAAARFASWLGRVPFLRMVAVCGSHAVENGDTDGDVDLFLVTEPGRLWLVQSITMVLRRFGHLRFGIQFCPNYLVTADRLELDERNLYVAREIAQIVPLWGADDYERFLASNRWITEFFPQLDLADRRRALRPRSRSSLTRLAESLLGGRLGHLTDRVIHRLLLGYYRLRLWRRGWRKDDIENAYRPDRQALIAGGYAGAVARRFLERARETLTAAGHDATERKLWHCFTGEDAEKEFTAADPHFLGLFTQRYGRRE